MRHDLPGSMWDKAAIGRLTSLWAAGHSTAEIGRQMGVSKNSVVGKAHRLDLPARPSPIRSRSGVPSADQIFRRQKVTLPPLESLDLPADCPAQPTRPLVVKPRVTPPQVVVPLPEPALVFTAAPSRPCCFPMWSHRERPTHIFCDGPGIPGRPYCPTHAALAFVRTSQASPFIQRAAQMVRAA